jgi:DNA-directed RNA polymerase subunit RPC12/RpoP
MTSPSTGIPCRKCGSFSSSVIRTTAKVGYYLRVRSCTQCGHKRQTTERDDEFPMLMREVRISIETLLQIQQFQKANELPARSMAEEDKS